MPNVKASDRFEVEIFTDLLPPRHRSYTEFAEAEVVLTSGPRRGTHVDLNFMPFTRLLLKEYDSGLYRRYWLSGPAQSGKSLFGLVIPSMYTICELGESFIFGAPTAEMAFAIYKERVEPSILASRYASLIPLAGAGSKGGRVPAITFLNGAIARFMGAGGGDAQRSGYTARAVGITETDKMDTPGTVSRETDPVSQMEERTAAWGVLAQTFAECTMSTKSGRIYREICEFGTDTQPYFRCPFCKRYVPLERENFHGWQEAPDEVAARERARYGCPSCSVDWTEGNRLEALKDPVFVSRGQHVDEADQVVGERPRTPSFGFRWNALASKLRSMGDIAEREWTADRSGKDDDKKRVLQFVWALPYEGEIPDLARVDVRVVLSKIVHHEQGAIPERAQKLTLAIDVGSTVCWWALVAWNEDASGHVVDYGDIRVPNNEDRKNPVAILAALRTFREDVVKPGWGGRRPNLVLIDSGYEQDVVYTFVRESGAGFVACKGFGMTSRWGGWRFGGGRSSELRRIGDEWILSPQPVAGITLAEIHSDYWRGQVHDGFAAPHGAPGSITLFSRPATDERARVFARQITAEHREVDPNPKKEEKIRWVLLSKKNHYLDCMTYARAGADMLGVKLVPLPKPVTPARPVPAVELSKKIRTQY